MTSIKASSAPSCQCSLSPKQMEDKMPEIDGPDETQIREIAYFLWLDEGCPEGRADDHWTLACGILSVSVASAAEPEGKASSPLDDPLSDTPVVVENLAKR